VGWVIGKTYSLQLTNNDSDIALGKKSYGLGGISYMLE
jgi:hypothetical protein